MISASGQDYDARYVAVSAKCITANLSEEPATYIPDEKERRMSKDILKMLGVDTSASWA